MWSLGLTTSALQNIDSIHALEAFVSFVEDDVVSVTGGNWQIFEEFVKRSRAQLFLKTEVGRLFCLSLANP
jgi:prenylcysteine oxidase/farnesylcysteine lyase